MLASKEQLGLFLKIFEAGNELSYKKGEFVIRPGQVPTGVFYIKSGIVKAYGISKYGEENLLIIRKEKEVFPLIWAITGQNRQIIYETMSPTLLLHLDRDKFFKQISEMPGLTLPLLDMVTEMYRIHSERILNLEYRTVRERLISFLITMSHRFGEKNKNNSVTLTVPLRQQDIASSINATRETTNREMTYLERHNLIKNKQSIITLLDLEKLNSFL